MVCMWMWAFGRISTSLCMVTPKKYFGLIQIGIHDQIHSLFIREFLFLYHQWLAEGILLHIWLYRKCMRKGATSQSTYYKVFLQGMPSHPNSIIFLFIIWMNIISNKCYWLDSIYIFRRMSFVCNYLFNVFCLFNACMLKFKLYWLMS